MRSPDTRRSDVLGSVRAPLAASASSLEELLADRIAGEVAKIAEDLIRGVFAVTEFDPDEVYGFMNSEEAAEFLGLPYSSFREIAPSLPRHAITPARFGYLRRELLAHFGAR